MLKEECLLGGAPVMSDWRGMRFRGGVRHRRRWQGSGSCTSGSWWWRVWSGWHKAAKAGQHGGRSSRAGSWGTLVTKKAQISIMKITSKAHKQNSKNTGESQLYHRQCKQPGNEWAEKPLHHPQAQHREMLKPPQSTAAIHRKNKKPKCLLHCDNRMTGYQQDKV